MNNHHGIHKLVEEMGELGQVIGKLCAFPDGDHPDGQGDLAARLNAELTDLEAVIAYYREANGVQRDDIRFLDKSKKFREWGLRGL